MFDEKTKQNLQHYVYMLIDPRNNKPFYIGKGINNRIFDHTNCALADLDITNAKYDLIRTIQNYGQSVGHIIVRHGLTEKEAFKIEASLIDAFQFSGVLLSNKVKGHKSIEKGLMTSDEVIRIYNAEPLNSISDDCMIININKNYGRGKSENAIYDATKGVWAISKKKVINKNGEILRKYVLSEHKGLVVEVFEVEDWFSQDRGYNSKAIKHGETRSGLAFKGKVAADNIRDLYINKSIAHHKKKGAASPHRYSL
jgi:uncharacterized protein